MTEREAIHRLQLVVGALVMHLMNTTNTQDLDVSRMLHELKAIYDATTPDA